MKVLIFLGNDAANYSIEGIVRKLRARHETRIFVPDNYKNLLHMFQDFKDEIQPVSKCGNPDYKWADCIFTTVMTAGRLQNISKYIFSFCHMNPCYDEARGYDFVFTLSDIKNQDVPRYFAYMPVGLAKNDLPATRKPKKQFLYIDAGHFPFGKAGQRQIAEMLLKICQAYPDYNLLVKPRWMPDADASMMSNPNFGHIYRELDALCPDGLPENLELLRGYENLQDLIDESKCVISSCTSAYLDAAMRGKPLLIMKGIKNQDMYHVRNAYFQNLYRFAEGSGCVVDYKEILSYLPKGLKCDPAHLKQAFAYPTGATDRVVKTMEYIVNRFLSKGLYPDIKRYSYENYRTELSAEANLDMTDLMARRRFCATETAVALTYKISDTLDFRPYYKRQMKLCEQSVKDPDCGFQKISKLRDRIVRLKCNYLIKHPNFVKNSVDASYLYYAMFYLGRKNDLMKLYGKSNAPHESLSYYAGLIYWELGQKAAAAQAMEAYLTQCLNRRFPKYYNDTWECMSAAFNITFRFLLNREDYKALSKYAELFGVFAKRYPRKKYPIAPSVLLRTYMALRQNNFQEQADLLKPWIKIKKPKKSLFREIAGRVFRVIKKTGGKILSFCKKGLRIIRKRFVSIGRGVKSAAGWLARAVKTPLSPSWHGIRRFLRIYSGEEKRILKFRNTQTGKACFVIGNGPSLTAEDLERARAMGYACFACNKIYKIFSRSDWRPDYYACFDRDVFAQNLHEILSNIDCPIFISRNFQSFVRQYQEVMGQKKRNIRYANYITRQNPRFYPQAANIRSGGSVTFILMELAWMMGFRTIYLIGCDHNYGVYENVGRNVKKIAPGEQAGGDYFTADYMRPGETMNIGDLKKAERGYQEARKYIESHGGHVYNATRGGQLEVFERVDLDTLLGFGKKSGKEMSKMAKNKKEGSN